MMTEPFESDQTKKWSHINNLVKDVSSKVEKSMQKSLFSFKFSSLVDSSTDQHIGVRIYSLGQFEDNTNCTLLYCDIKGTDSTQISSANVQPTEGSDAQLVSDDNLDLPTFQWKPLLRNESVDESFSEKLSIEEQLVLERKRIRFTGITNYELHEMKRRFIFSINGTLHYFDDNGTQPYLPIQLPSKVECAKINQSICPWNPDLVAYIGENNLFVLNIQTGVELQLTNNKVDYPNRKLISGLPSYIVQEEFDRYVGFWWQPINKNDPTQYGILFEQVDETDVEIFRISTSDGQVEEYSYPRPGKKNAVSTVKIANFTCDPNSNELHNPNIKSISNLNDLKQIYPDCEYLIDCKWYDHDTIVVQLMNRKQHNLLVFMISLTGAFETQVIYEEINSIWVDVNQVLEFVSPKSETEEILKAGTELTFIWASQESGYRHLYKISVKLAESSNSQTDGLLRSTLLKKIQLTSGHWQVDSKGVAVDNNNHLIYFAGLKDSPLERQLYVTSMDDEQRLIKKLTTSGYSHSVITFDSRCSVFLNIQSSIKTPPFGFFNVIHHTANQLPSIFRVGYILSNKITKPDGSIVNCIEEIEMLPGFSRPELFSYQMKSGDVIYGLIYKPYFMQADKKYPCVLSVYGGPHYQGVTNTFRMTREISKHLLTSQGYVVCVMDCPGSSNRGLNFEAHLNRQLGQVEVQDHVEVLEWLASTTNYIDLNRVAVNGYSYGGYLSLLCYAKRPDIFRVCIAGAPVTDWQFYDTGYTERYMDLPENNEEGYAKGNVLNLVGNFPNEENRLLIIHGLSDENVHFRHSVELINQLVKSNKPYSLQVFPSERHSLRGSQTLHYYYTSLISFLNQNL